MSRLDAHARRLSRLEDRLVVGTDAPTFEVPSLHTFLKDAWHVLEPATPFVDGWHLQCISEHLEAVTRGQIKRLLINVPPRFCKSTLVSVMWPVWSWLTNPSISYLCASYALSLAIRDNRKSRMLIQSPWFQSRYGSAFRLSDDQNAKSYFENDRRGYRMSVSTGSSSTGFGGSVLLGDDLHAIDEKESVAARESALDWFDTTFSTRLNSADGAICVIGQRIHQADVSGHIIEQGGWEHLNLPAEFEPTRRCFTPTLRWSDPRREEGELLWPDRFTRATLEQQRRNLGSIAYASLYQQSPVPAGGAIFRKEWLRYFSETDEAYLLETPSGNRGVLKSACWSFGTVDLAISSKTTADYTVIAVWAVTKERDLLLLDLIRGRFDFAEQQRQIELIHQRYHLNYTKIETVAYQLAIAQQLLKKGVPVREYKPVKDKVSRASTAAIWYENGKMFHRRGVAWEADVESELLMFPKGAHDDIVDVISLAADTVTSGYSQLDALSELQERAAAREKIKQMVADQYW